MLVVHASEYIYIYICLISHKYALFVVLACEYIYICIYVCACMYIRVCVLCVCVCVCVCVHVHLHEICDAIYPDYNFSSEGSLENLSMHLVKWQRTDDVTPPPRRMLCTQVNLVMPRPHGISATCVVILSLENVIIVSIENDDVLLGWTETLSKCLTFSASVSNTVIFQNITRFNTVLNLTCVFVYLCVQIYQLPTQDLMMKIIV